MGERIKKVFSSRIFISVSGAIIAYFIVGIINSFTGKINLWESLLNLPVKIYLIKIPDFIILIFVLIIIIWLILINKKLSALSRGEMYIGFSEVEKEELEILKEEHKTILEYLIQQENYGAYRSKLLESYKLQYPEKSELEFSIKLKEMQRLGYITQQETQWGLAVRITDRASEKLAKLNQR